jgi:serine/threonine protein kinase
MIKQTSRAAEVVAGVIEAPEDKRRTLVERACDGDAALRGEVERLLGLGPHLLDFLAMGATQDDPPGPAGRGGVVRFGRYRVLRLICEGGMGTVYEAEQDHPNRRVALKVIKLGMDTRQVIARFEAEREALGIMDHPNVAKVFDAGSTDTGRPFFAMELVKGVPVTEYCDANHLGVRERLELFVSVCRAVHHAHQKGIIHRDIKPGNVLVTLVDGNPVPKVIDFGIAKAVHQKLSNTTLVTEYRQLIGTPEYMSPEQAEMTGIDIDTRSDVYSLGVLLYELLAGITPFDSWRLRRADHDEVRRLIRDVEPQRPSTRLSRLGQGRPAGEGRDGRSGPSRGTGPGPGLGSAAGGEDWTGGRVKSGEQISGEQVARHRGTDAATLYKTLRRDLDWIVMKAIEKDRTRRYDTAGALAEDVQRFLADRPLLAAPPGAGYRLRKFARRNRPALRTVAVVAMALVLGAAGAAFGLFRARVERARAAAAEPLLLDAYTRLKADRSAALEDKRSAVRSLVTLYENWGKPDRASQWKWELEVLDAGTYAAHATEHAIRGEFAQAAVDYEQALRRDPSNQWWWYQSACLRVQLGDAEGYKSHCLELLRRFAEDPNPMIGERTAKACLLRSDPVADANTLSAMVDRSLARSEGHPLRGWFELAKGVAEYRARRAESATEWLERSLRHGGMSPQGTGTAWVVLAMAYHECGRAEDAADVYARGVAEVEEGFARSGTKPPGAEWHDWIIFDVFRREAAGMIGVAGAKPSRGQR